MIFTCKNKTQRSLIIQYLQNRGYIRDHASITDQLNIDVFCLAKKYYLYHYLKEHDISLPFKEFWKWQAERL